MVRSCRSRFQRDSLNNRTGQEWVCLGRRRVGPCAEAESGVGVATDANCPREISTIHLNFGRLPKAPPHAWPRRRFAEGCPLSRPIDNRQPRAFRGLDNRPNEWRRYRILLAPDPAGDDVYITRGRTRDVAASARIAADNLIEPYRD